MTTFNILNLTYKSCKNLTLVQSLHFILWESDLLLLRL